MTGEIKLLTVGQAASNLDIFLSANGTAVSGKYVGFQLFDAADISAVSGVALNPDFGHYTGSGTIPAGYQLGHWHIDWTIVTQSDSVLFASEQFTVQDLTVSIGFVPSTDDTQPLYDAVRIDIGDPDGIIFDDDFLKRVLIKAARRLNQRLGLSFSCMSRGSCVCYCGSRSMQEIGVDLDTGSITPDNSTILDFIIMQMELIILESEVSALKRLSASSSSGPFSSIMTSISGDGVSVTNADGVSISISPSRLTVRSDLHKYDVGLRRETFEAAVKAYLFRLSSCYGRMVF